jgi:hypothetical protein
MPEHEVAWLGKKQRAAIKADFQTHAAMQRAAAEVKIKKNLTLVKAIDTLETLQMASVYFDRTLNSRELSLRRDGMVGGRWTMVAEPGLDCGTMH